METDVVVGPSLHVETAVGGVLGVFPEDGAGLAHLTLDELVAFDVGQVVEFGTACFADFDGDFLVHAQSGGIGPVGIGEDVEVGDGEAVDKGFALLESHFVLAVETGNHIGGDAGMGHHFLDVFDTAGKKAGVVAAVHHFQHFVGTGLEGDMEMGKEGARGGDKVDYFFGNEVGLDAGNAEAENAFYFIELTQKVDELFPVLLTKGACVDTGENHLFGAGLGNDTCGGNGLVDSGRAASATGKGDCAVAAEVVAAVLYFEKCAGAVVPRPTELETMGLVGVDTYGMARGCRFGSSWRRRGGEEAVFNQYVEKEVFAVVAKNNVNSGDFLNLCGVDLGKAANHGNYGIGILGDGLTYCGAAFFFGDRCYGARIYYVNIGLLVVVDYVKTYSLKLFLQMAGFSKIKFAT